MRELRKIDGESSHLTDNCPGVDLSYQELSSVKADSSSSAAVSSWLATAKPVNYKTEVFGGGSQLSRFIL